MGAGDATSFFSWPRQPLRVFITLMTLTANTTARTTDRVWVRRLMTMALVFAGILLLSNLGTVQGGGHAYLSSLPLAVAGFSYAILQLYIGPPRAILLKRLLLAVTFVLWAIDQLLPPGRLATFIGDVVIAAYVLDLFWIIQEQTAAVESRKATPQAATLPR